ncbi:HK97 gp10 family phage protein [Azospirillum agricola]|uniref:HK97 gp10 family phage protein n=1 Tax=Azospirillum agricola TaxID=1720247 RepID=UPI000A0F28A0|nr:HK97 gp10 family phage protein [Azospirillum agricola]SMH29707.1 Bacteriophage HK97-gp10, putative tail-component [Azospirillum lipoferum]
MAKSTVSGARSLRAALRKLPIDIKADVAQAVATAGAAIHAEAVAAAPGAEHPYATGKLKRKLRLLISRDGLQARVGSWGKRRIRHVHLVEFGAAPHDIVMPEGGVIHHPGAPAQPFLFPAYRRHRAASLKRIRAAVRDALARAAQRGGK